MWVSGVCIRCVLYQYILLVCGCVFVWIPVTIDVKRRTIVYIQVHSPCIVLISGRVELWLHDNN